MERKKTTLKNETVLFLHVSVLFFSEKTQKKKKNNLIMSKKAHITDTDASHSTTQPRVPG